MENSEILRQLFENATFMTLFIWLLYDTKKDSKKREEDLKSTLKETVVALNKAVDMQEDVKEVKQAVMEIKDRL